MSGIWVIVGGMLIGKFGQSIGFPWRIYYSIPVLVTLFYPPYYFKMTKREVCEYVILSLLAAPVIQRVFSLFLGWNEYMPFLKIRSFREILL